MSARRFDPLRRRLIATAALAPFAAAPAAAAASEEAQVIDLKADLAISRLFRSVRGSEELVREAKGVLVVPQVTKAGLFVGGLYGEGALRINGTTVAYYALAAASFGLQAGAQRFDQALLFMTTEALERFRRSEGWEIGVDAEVTTPERGISATLNSTVARNPVIAFTYGQEGLMAGASVEGAKFTRIYN